MATKAKEDERKFTLECIEVYHSLPALWNVKSKDYSNRMKEKEKEKEEEEEKRTIRTFASQI